MNFQGAFRKISAGVAIGLAATTASGFSSPADAGGLFLGVMPVAAVAPTMDLADGQKTEISAAEEMVRALEAASGGDETLNLEEAFLAALTEVLTEAPFADAECYKEAEGPSSKRHFSELIQDAANSLSHLEGGENPQLLEFLREDSLLNHESLQDYVCDIEGTQKIFRILFIRMVQKILEEWIGIGMDEGECWLSDKVEVATWKSTSDAVSDAWCKSNCPFDKSYKCQWPFGPGDCSHPACYYDEPGSTCECRKGGDQPSELYLPMPRLVSSCFTGACDYQPDKCEFLPTPLKHLCQAAAYCATTCNAAGGSDAPACMSNSIQQNCCSPFGASKNACFPVNLRWQGMDPVSDSHCSPCYGIGVNEDLNEDDFCSKPNCCCRKLWGGSVPDWCACGSDDDALDVLPEPEVPGPEDDDPEEEEDPETVSPQGEDPPNAATQALMGSTNAMLVLLLAFFNILAF